MIHFAYPNVSTSRDSFIGCGRYVVLPAVQPSPEKYEYMRGLPNISNASAVIRTAKILAKMPYNSELIIYEREDDHDPDEIFQGDSCSFAFLMALINRSLPLRFCASEPYDLWFTGKVHFDEGPRLEAVIPSSFDLKLKGFLASTHRDKIFFVPSANILQHHEAICSKEHVEILELENYRRLKPAKLFDKKTIVTVDLDQLPTLVDLLFQTAGDPVLDQNGEQPGRVNPSTQTAGRATRRKRAVLLAVAAFLLIFSGYLLSSHSSKKDSEKTIAKGMALEQRGKLDEALEHFEQAAAINGDDPVAAVLYRRSRERLAERESTERSARIDALVSDLVKTYREGPEKPIDTRDGWSSRPLYVFFTGVEAKGQSAPREGEDVYLTEEIVRNMMQSTRLRLTERARLDRLMEELKLSRTELSDPETALRLGKILSARVACAATVLRSHGELRIMLRAIDVESTLLIAVSSGTSPKSEAPEKMIERLALDFERKITSAYPLRARIVEIGSDEVTLDVGSSVGMTPGMKLRVAEEEANGIELVVNSVHSQSSIAASCGAEGVLKKGWRVEES